MDAAAGHDGHVAVLTHVKVVVDQILQPGLGDDDGDVNGLVFRTGLDEDINAGLVLFFDNVDVGAGLAAVSLAVETDVVSPLGNAVDIRHLTEKLLLDFR